MSNPTSSALAAIGPEISSARPATLPGDLVAAAEVLKVIDARLAEAEKRDGMTGMKRGLVARLRVRMGLLAEAARAIEARDQSVHAAIVAYVSLPEPLGPSSLARRDRMVKVVAAGMPEARRTLKRLALGDHAKNAYERALDLRELASLYGRHGVALASVAGYDLGDEPLAFREARALFALVQGEVRDASRLGDHARLWTLLEHGHAAAVATLAYLYGDSPPEVPPL